MITVTRFFIFSQFDLIDVLFALFVVQNKKLLIAPHLLPTATA